MTAIAKASPLLALVLSLNGCIYPGEWGDSERFKQDFQKTFQLQPGGAVSVENFNGSIDILGWDEASVQVNATKFASTKDLLDSLEVDMTGSPTEVHIRTLRSEAFWQGSQGVRYSLRVPKRIKLDRIVSSNGAIRIEDVNGNAQVRTSNGAIRVDGLTGDLEAQTTNGRIEIRGLDGNANVHTSNGTIDAESTHGSFDASTSNGRIAAVLKDPNTSRPVRLQSSNGRLELRIDGSALPPIHARTTNSRIVVFLPASANARLEARTTHGSVTSEFDDLNRSRSRRERELDGNIGHGGPLIELESTNGSIQVLKR